MYKDIFEKLKEERANSSLFFLILLPVTMLILFATFANAQTRRNELDFIRASESNLDLILADYDRQLWQEFGLWGVDENSLNQYSEELLNNYIESEYILSNKIIGTKDLKETEQLRTQILRHMSVRAPIFFLDQLSSRFTEFQEISKKLNNSDFWFQSSTQYLDPDKIISDPNLAKGDLSDLGLEEDIFTEEKKENSTEETDILKEKSLGILEELVEQAKEMIIPIYQSTGAKIPSQPLAPDSIQSIAAFADQITSTYDLPVISKIQINEYMFSYYTMQCSKTNFNGTPQKTKTPDGRLHENLIENGRKNEVEQIIFENLDSDQAGKNAKSFIGAIRFMYHLLDKTLDELQQSIYLLEATEISLLIAIASLGEIVLEPNSLVYILLLIDTLTETFEDLDKLVEGELVNFSIGEVKVNMSYQDFMRVFALIKPEENILEGLNKVREKTIKGNFITSFELKGNFDNSSINLQREFSDYLPELELISSNVE